MKNLIVATIAIFIFCNSNAQYCGNSGPSQCSHLGITAPSGFTPQNDSLPPLINGIYSTTVIQIRYDTVNFGGQRLTVSGMRIDSIKGLPANVCWATDTANNTFDSTGGCLRLNGSPCAYPGQYKPVIYLSVNIGVLITTTADAAGAHVFLRVKNNGDPDTPVDTTQTVSNPFITYGENSICGGTGIESPGNSFSSLAISPNPFTDKASVIFFSNGHLRLITKLTDIVGKEIYRKEIEAIVGENKTEIGRENLSAGVYFYSITDGKTSIVKRIVIAN